MFAYSRPQLAHQMVQALQGQSFLGDAHNGLFLAAPRRTGKTTFLRSDLTPALQVAGIAVVYVDLWADAARDPGALIAEAIAQRDGELAEFLMKRHINAARQNIERKIEEGELTI